MTVKNAKTRSTAPALSLVPYTLTADDAKAINAHRQTSRTGPDAGAGDVHPALKTGETSTKVVVDAESGALGDATVEHFTVFLVGHTFHASTTTAK